MTYFFGMTYFFAMTCIFAVLLTSCGFKLRGSHSFPQWIKAATIINQTTNPPLTPLLGGQLVSYGVSLHPTSELKGFLIILETDNYQQNIISIAASTTPRQYELIYSLQFSILQDKKPLVSQRKISIRRLFTLNNDRILGSNDEESIIKREMQREAIRQILNQLSLIPHAD